MTLVSGIWHDLIRIIMYMWFKKMTWVDLNHYVCNLVAVLVFFFFIHRHIGILSPWDRLISYECLINLIHIHIHRGQTFAIYSVMFLSPSDVLPLLQWSWLYLLSYMHVKSSAMALDLIHVHVHATDCHVFSSYIHPYT